MTFHGRPYTTRRRENPGRIISVLVAAVLVVLTTLLVATPLAISSPGWPAPQNISASITANYTPQIALDAWGSPHVVWTGQDGTTSRIYYSENTGSGWSAPENISGTLPGSPVDDKLPQIALDDDGNPHVTWTGNDGAVRRIYYSERNAVGVWQPLEIVSGAGPTPTNNSSPQMALDNDGNPHVTWTGQDGSGVDRTYYSEKTGAVWPPPNSISGTNPTPTENKEP